MNERVFTQCAFTHFIDGHQTDAARVRRHFLPLSRGWAKEDLSPRIDGALDLRFLSKATGQSVDALSRW